MAGRLLGSWNRNGYEIAAVATKKLGKYLAKDFREIFGSSQNDEAERLGALARTTIECIARSDALYHTYGAHHARYPWSAATFCEDGRLAHYHGPARGLYPPSSSLCLLHDIGFVRGVLSGDTKTGVRHRQERGGRLQAARAERRTRRLPPIMSIDPEIVRLRTVASGKSTTIDLLVSPPRSSSHCFHAEPKFGVRIKTDSSRKTGSSR